MEDYHVYTAFVALVIVAVVYYIYIHSSTSPSPLLIVPIQREVNTQQPWYSLILSGRKTVEARPGRTCGDLARANIRLVCGNHSRVMSVVSVHHYDDLDSYLTGEGWQNVAPHTNSFEEARAAYLAITHTRGPVYLADAPVTALRLSLDVIPW